MRSASLTGKNREQRTVKAFLKKMHRESKGFTLVELLIVIAILGILAAVVLPDVTGRAGEGQTEAATAEMVTVQTEAATAEMVTVQTAMDTMMVKNSLTSVTATSATSNMSAFPAGNALYPDYLSTAIIRGTYSCSTTGLVAQATTGY